MNTSHLAIAVESSQSVCELETFISRLIQDTKDTEKRLKNKKDISDRSASAIKKMSALEQTILDNKNKIIEAESAKQFIPDSWVVLHGANKPGQVVKPKITGKTLAILVLWDNANAPVPERVARLKLVDADKCQYIWNGDRYSKLIRPIDGHECDNTNVLSNHLSRLQLEVESDLPEKWQAESKQRIAYCRKRIDYFSSSELRRLESVVDEGLAVFYRVGEALAEIRDRQLYKQQDYTDFRTYLKERWKMGKSKAYRLIDAAEVMNNLKSVPNWGQNELDKGSDCGQLPDNEAIARELAKAPPENQIGVWRTAVENSDSGNPTAKEVREIVQDLLNSSGNADSSCPGNGTTSRLFCGKLPTENATYVQTDYPDKDFAVQTDYPGNKTLVENFNVGQLVQIKSDRANREDKRLIGLDLGVATVIKINPSTLTIKIWGQEIDCVSINDLTVLDENNMPAICLYPSADDYRILNNFSSKQEIIKAANAARSLAI